MQIGGAFDGAHIRNFSKEGLIWEINQVEFTGHNLKLEEDYELARKEFGMSLFRDATWLKHTHDHSGYRWDYMDRLAESSRGQVLLTIAHYDIPEGVTYQDFVGGEFTKLMSQVAYQIAKRYRGCFYGYIPLNEIGYWVKKMSDWPDWWPWHDRFRPLSWWQQYEIMMKTAVSMAMAIREADPNAKIALCEPGAWSQDFQDKYHLDDKLITRPFHGLAGSFDALAEQQLGIARFSQEDLLDIIGLNIYHNLGDQSRWSIYQLLLETREQFPDKEVIISETGTCHDIHNIFTDESWYEMLEKELSKANAHGANVHKVIQAPLLTIADFDTGEKASGALIGWDKDQKYRRSWNPEVAKRIRAWNRQHSYTKEARIT